MPWITPLHDDADVFDPYTPRYRGVWDGVLLPVERFAGMTVPSDLSEELVVLYDWHMAGSPVRPTRAATIQRWILRPETMDPDEMHAFREFLEGLLGWEVHEFLAVCGASVRDIVRAIHAHEARGGVPLVSGTLRRALNSMVDHGYDEGWT